MLRVVGTLAFDTVGLVGRLADRDTTARVRRLETRAGGTAGNVAVALARLGARPSVAAAVGPDFRGSAYERRLASLGVDLADVAVVDAPTAHAYVWSAEDGAQATYFFPGAGADLAKAPVRPAALAHFSAGEMTAYRPHMEAADVVTFDPGQEVFHRPLEHVLDLLPLVDVLFLNANEAVRLEREAGLDAAEAWRRGVGAVVVTRGKEGCDVCVPEGTVHVPAVPAEVVDPTGAGDAHRAGFVLGLARGLAHEEAARLGAVAAAFAIEAVGPQEGAFDLPTFRERYARAFGPCPV